MMRRSTGYASQSNLMQGVTRESEPLEYPPLIDSNRGKCEVRPRPDSVRARTADSQDILSGLIRTHDLR